MPNATSNKLWRTMPSPLPAVARCSWNSNQEYFSYIKNAAMNGITSIVAAAVVGYIRAMPVHRTVRNVYEIIWNWIYLLSSLLCWWLCNSNIIIISSFIVAIVRRRRRRTSYRLFSSHCCLPLIRTITNYCPHGLVLGVVLCIDCVLLFAWPNGKWTIIIIILSTDSFTFSNWVNRIRHTHTVIWSLLSFVVSFFAFTVVVQTSVHINSHPLFAYGQWAELRRERWEICV